MLKMLTVENSFTIEGRGTILTPALPYWPGATEGDDAAEIRRPNGSVAQCELQVCEEHISRNAEAIRAGVPAFHRVCVIRGLRASDVPAGSELWCRDDLVRRAEAAGDN